MPEFVSFCVTRHLHDGRDLTLGEVVYIAIIYHIPDSWIYLLNGFDFYFWSHDWWKPRILQFRGLHCRRLSPPPIITFSTAYKTLNQSTYNETPPLPPPRIFPNLNLGGCGFNGMAHRPQCRIFQQIAPNYDYREEKTYHFHKYCGIYVVGWC